MTRNEVIQWADESGAIVLEGYEVALLERFAQRVAAAEREACAMVCESLQDWPERTTPYDCAGAIRARGDE